MARECNTVGVVGLGTMGAGIVEVFARNGVPVVAVEIDQTALDRGRANLTASTDRAVARGKLDPADRDALHARVTFAVGLAALSEVDLVVEAVPERLDLKQRLLAALDQACKPDAILATNTSSLSVTEIAVATSRPERVVGLHFFNPAPVMKLVEVVRTVVTDPAVVADVEALCRRLGKVGVTLGDRAGFIANWLLFGYLNQAIGMYESRYASREDIDTAMRLGCRLPMGPLALLDLIGLDTAYEVLDTMYRRGGRDRRHAPAPLLRQMVTAGLLGRKSGRGFYTYEAPGSSRLVVDDRTPSAGQPGRAGQQPAARESAGGAVPVRTVGIVGGGPTADHLAAASVAAGHTVVAVAYDGPGTDLAGLAAADLVVETIAGDLATTRALLAALDAACQPAAVLATTTSTLPVVDLAMATGRPEQVLGLHLPAPAPQGDLVEVVRTVRTAPPAVATVAGFCTGLGRTVVTCDDRAGQLVGALLTPYLNDAVRMLEAGYATADDIDAAMTLGCGYPTGPFALIDTLGLDTVLAVQEALYDETREPGLAPAPLLRHLVTAGRLGRHVGHGFRPHPQS
ncbi:3-hydroxybutyryl-CoA dehydrogenase [Solwaraspora sp. WMMA2056]|uniref:3-hydroxyacyl-CoA dehydrogenase family protein n=1 Tax=Solwaraspora sp. WMMA2056 TaxID=3015161 RepID=UPI00259BD9FD|nr:3-hydroxyacyl-CoA dehydrogenase [Solwaraspora sp. WMMA2056]WJK42946.1 3-hydroxybutyryl-CoA dehydrogenase [Solwaraspora sp. WMMA2056]